MCITEVRIPKETGVLNLLVLVSKGGGEGRGTAYCSDLVAVLGYSLNFLKIVKLLRREGEPCSFFFPNVTVQRKQRLAICWCLH